MVDGLLTFVLGFSVCGLIALLLRPFMWQRAHRVALKRLSLQLPLTYEELEAQRDFQRADFAVRQHALQQELDRARENNSALMAQNGQLHLSVLSLREALAGRPDLELKIAIQQQEILRLTKQNDRQALRIAQLERIQAKAFERLQKARKVARMRLFAHVAVRLGLGKKDLGKKELVKKELGKTSLSQAKNADNNMLLPTVTEPVGMKAARPVSPTAQGGAQKNQADSKALVQAIQVLGSELAVTAKAGGEGHNEAQQIGSPQPAPQENMSDNDEPGLAITVREDDEMRLIQERAAIKALRKKLDKQVKEFDKILLRPMIASQDQRADTQARLLRFAAMMADYTARLDGKDNVIDTKIKEAGALRLANRVHGQEVGQETGQEPSADDSLLLGLIEQARVEAVREQLMPF